MLRWLDNLPWLYLIIAMLTLGLAPFTPEPHVWEKLRMLLQGELSRPLDIFDLCLHGTPFILAILKSIRSGRGGSSDVPSGSDNSDFGSGNAGGSDSGGGGSD